MWWAAAGTKPEGYLASKDAEERLRVLDELPRRRPSSVLAPRIGAEALLRGGPVVRPD